MVLNLDLLSSALSLLLENYICAAKFIITCYVMIYLSVIMKLFVISCYISAIFRSKQKKL